MRAWLAIACLVLAVAAAPATFAGAASSMQETQIEKQEYLGWPNSYRLSNGILEARVVTDIGPRIMDVRRVGGENLLYVRRQEAGKSGELQWTFRGGWRLWVAPERQETTYALDNEPCVAEVDGNTLRVTGPKQLAAGIQKQVDITLRPGESRLRIVSHIANISGQPLRYAAWSLPVLRPGGRAFVPVDVGSPTAFDDVRRYFLWSYTEIDDPRYRWGNRLIEIDHRKVRPAPLRQEGRRDDESKIGSDSAQGWAAYWLDGVLFLKRFPHVPGKPYPDGGATIEVYSSAEFLELENLGPLTGIAAGESIQLPEDWWLFPQVTIPAGEEAALNALRPFIEQTAW
jgi:hypothetical protein